MSNQTAVIDKVVIAAVVLVSLVSLLCTQFVPAFMIGNDAVYGGF